MDWIFLRGDLVPSPQAGDIIFEPSFIHLLVKEETGMPVFIAEYPLDCVAIGTGKSVEDQEIFEKVLVANKRR